MSRYAEHPIPAGFSLLDPTYAHSFIAHIGPLYVRPEADGHVRIGVILKPYHCNPFGEIHGGCVAALADFVCAYTMLRGPDPTPSVVTIQLGTQMIASASQGQWVEAHAAIRRKGRTIAHVGCDFFTQGEQLIAHADAVFRVLSAEGVARRLQRRLHVETPPENG